MADTTTPTAPGEQTLPVTLDLDTRRFRTALIDADRMTKGFSTSLGRAFGDAANKGKGLDKVIIGLGKSLAKLATRELTRGIGNAFGSGGILGGLMKGLGGGGGGGEGPSIPSDPFSDIFDEPPTAFARGGVLSAPSYFPMPQGGGLGLAGERGAEAILPLARGPDGRLGVRSDGGGGGNVTVHVHAQDIESFRRSEAAISATLARAVARGRRAL
jgi:phage-related minor tail protein